MTEFRIEERVEQPYVAVVGHVTMATIPEIADRFGEVFGWLGERGVNPAGSPFMRYRVIDMERELVIEAAVPVATLQTGEGEIVADTVPAGRYACTTYVGSPQGLQRATGELLRWAEEQGLAFDEQESDAGYVWGGRLEIYDTDPGKESDPEKWQTRLAVKLAD